MKKHIHTYITIILLALITGVMLSSCNLQGEGIFTSIAGASKVEDKGLYDRTAMDVIGEKNDYLLAYTDGGVLYGYKDNTWYTMEDTSSSSYTPKIMMVLDEHGNLFARGKDTNSNKIYKGTISNNSVDWDDEEDFSSIGTVVKLGILDGDAFVLIAEDQDLKIFDSSNWNDGDVLGDIDLNTDKTNIIHAISTGEYLLVTVVEVDETGDSKEYEHSSYIYKDGSFDSNILKDNSLTDEKRFMFTGALHHDDGIDEYLFVSLTYLNEDERRVHELHRVVDLNGGDIEIKSDTKVTVPDFQSRFAPVDDRQHLYNYTPMAVFDGKIYVAGRNGLYAGGITGSLSRPSDTFYNNVSRNNKQVNGLFVDNDTLYLALKDYWVFVVDDVDNHAKWL